MRHFFFYTLFTALTFLVFVSMYVSLAFAQERADAGFALLKLQHIRAEQRLVR